MSSFSRLYRSLNLNASARSLARYVLIGVAGLLACVGYYTRRARHDPTRIAARMRAESIVRPWASHPLLYRLFIPGPASEKRPLIVFLHRAGVWGTDNISQLEPSIEWLISDHVQRLEPTFVVAPQCPEEDQWINIKMKLPLKPVDLSQLIESDSNKLVVALVDDLIARYPIDPDRVYLMGYSLGAAGTWDILMRHPGVFAAGVPIAGIGDITRGKLLANTPIWHFHGELDEVGPAENDRRMFEALKQAGVDVRYTELKGFGHGVSGPALAEPNLFTWLFAQRRHSLH